ncbi:helix-turn-helix domain-containing protein [Paractinoplanes globisporus]|uniref:Helix-turn-helix domain-containing protein n=1 Tax=Paractinoplanes globisporus TaxID=113565 RepID=A0ABW6WVG7_9ACTN|nr:helix-turn-helix transcriptional regulator [Actinoplanes globisporus]
MAESPDPAVLRRRLQIELRKSREATGQSQKEVADALAWSPSKLLRIENGAVGITVTDLRALLGHYGVRGKQVDELTRLAQGSRKLTTATYGKSVPTSTIKFWNLRSSAVRVRQFETLLIPGLLQTEEYAREVITSYSTPDLSSEDIDDRVAARMDQQGLLDREDRPELYFMIDEAALRRWVGGPEVMRNQLDRLKKRAEADRLTIQVLPFELGVHGGIRGPFQILEFAEGEDYVLYIDDAAGGLASRDMEAETERYLTLFWDLEAVATKPWELNGFLDKVLADFNPKPAGNDAPESNT